MLYDRWVPSPIIFWPCLTGLTFLVLGILAVRRELLTAPGIEKLVVLGRVFFAAPLALFGAEHLAGARFIMQVVPPWMPARIFWVYFVGVALIAAALSIVLMERVRLSGTLLGIMFFLFVLMLHLPNVAANPKDRIVWAVAFRDLSFAGGAWALAGTQITIARLCVAIPLLLFGIAHLFYPQFAPGVPLAKVTPNWVPIRALWGYLTGVFLLAAGAAILINKQARAAATWLGLWITLITVFLYLPILILATGTRDLNEGQNYVADTLLFAGAILVLAAKIR